MKATVVKGDDATLTFTIQDALGVIIDLTGALAITFKAATSLASATPEISLSLGSGVENTTPLSGEIIVTLTPTETDLPAGIYFFELQITDSSGVISTVRDIDDRPGELTILDDLD